MALDKFFNLENLAILKTLLHEMLWDMLFLQVVSHTFVICILFCIYRVSASLRLTNERDRLAQNDLDIKCFQLLRGLIHNEIIKLPEDAEETSKKSKRYGFLLIFLSNGSTVSLCLTIPSYGIFAKNF